MFVRRIAVVGTGYVGLTTGTCLASLGHRVVCADVDAAKIGRLRRGEVDILEPGLPELVSENVLAGRLSFVLGGAEAVADAEVMFLCVPTPMGEGGAADLAAVEAVIAEVRELLKQGADLSHLNFLELLQVEDLAVAPGEPLKLQAEDFVDAIRAGRRPLVDAEDGFAAVRTADRIVAAGGRCPSPLDQLKEVVAAVKKPVQAVGGLDRAAGHREHVPLHESVHAGDADR